VKESSPFSQVPPKEQVQIPMDNIGSDLLEPEETPVFGKEPDEGMGQIRELIAEGGVSKALERMRQLVKDRDLKDQVIQLSGRLEALVRENNQGVISRQDLELSRNRINYSALQILEDWQRRRRKTK